MQLKGPYVHVCSVLFFPPWDPLIMFFKFFWTQNSDNLVYSHNTAFFATNSLPKYTFIKYFYMYIV